MPLDANTINCFTDGSKTDTGAGAGYIIKSHTLANTNIYT